MATSRTLPSGDGTDDAATADGRSPRPGRLGLLASRRPAGIDDRQVDPSAPSDIEVLPGWAAPPVADVAPLVIDLTGELHRDPPPAATVARPVVPGEFARLAMIHAGQLPNGFFVRFGTRFLAAYLGTFAPSPAATALAVGPVGAPRGFVVGTWDNPRHYRWLLRHPGPLVRSALPALAVRPRLAYELLRTRAKRYLRGILRLLRRSRGASGPPEDGLNVDETTPVVAVLTHVAVAPDAGGEGLGRTLVEAFVAYARDRGADEVRLIAHASTRAPDFYRHLGWSSLGERRSSDGTLVEEFQLVL